MASIKELINWGSNQISEVTSTPKLEAEVLLAKVLEKDRAWLIAYSNQEISAENEKLFLEYIKRRMSFEPIAHITNTKEFYGLDFIVNQDVLIPRPETELLVEKALLFLSGLNGPKHILELGVGSGCIITSILKNLKNLNEDSSFLGVDISSKALNIARENLTKHNAIDRIELLESSWFSAIPKSKKFDLIVSNPPYVSRSEVLQPDLSFEPEHALFAGDSGIADIEKIIKDATDYLNPRARLIIEFGFGQSSKILELAKANGFAAKVHADLAGIDRIAELTLDTYEN